MNTEKVILQTNITRSDGNGSAVRLPYRRIVGLDFGRIKLASKRDAATVGCGVSYTAHELPAWFALRLADFFDRFLVAKRPAGYNCHVFAAAMAGERLSLNQAADRAAEIIRQGKVVANVAQLALGAQAVVRAQTPHELILPEHSLVAFPGRDAHYLQVLADQGYLGIATSHSIADAYPHRQIYTRL